MTLELHNTENPISNAERLKINENWQRIISGYSYLQQQIKVLAGGAEVDELIQRLNDAVDNANVAVQEAIDANNTATQKAIEANNAALQTALQTVSNKLTELVTAISNAETATQDANAAKNAAIQAAQDAQNAINSMQSLIDNFAPKGPWSSTTQYYKHNLAEVDGRTYIALKDNINTPVTDKSTWALFADKGATGATGPQGLPGKDGKDGTGVNIIGSLSSEADLPQTGSPGDAYMIGGDLYVWQANLNNWKNVGPIQGPEGKSAYTIAVENGFVGTMEEWLESLKGKTGPPGPEGPQGPPADLTEVNQEIANLQQTVTNNQQVVTEHLAERILSEDGAHGIRYFNDKLEYHDGTSWNEIETGTDVDYTKDTPYVVTTGTPSLYEVSLDHSVTELVEGMSLAVKIHETNAGFSKLKVNGLDEKYIILNSGGLAPKGSLVKDMVYTLRYNGSYFIIQGNEVKPLKKVPITPWSGWNNFSTYGLYVAKNERDQLVYVRGALEKTAQSTQILAQLPEGYRPAAGERVAVSITAPVSGTYKTISGYLADQGMLMAYVLSEITSITNNSYIYFNFSFIYSDL